MDKKGIITSVALLITVIFCCVGWLTTLQKLDETQWWLDFWYQTSVEQGVVFSQQRDILKQNEETITLLKKHIALQEQELKGIYAELEEKQYELDKLKQIKHPTAVSVISDFKHFKTKQELVDYLDFAIWSSAGNSDCDKRAEFLMEYSFRQGYYVTWHLFDGTKHMANMAYVEDEDAFYGVDTRRVNGKVWYICQRE